MSYKYSRYINRVTRQPWAITAEKLLQIQELVRERAAGHKPSDEEIVARLGDDTERRSPAARSDGAVAVIPIHGCIAHRADSFEASSGGTSTEVIGRLLDRVVGDDSFKAVVLDFDTPGGSVEGVPELAAKIARATAIKPIIGVANAAAYSAGLWLISQCSEIVCTPSGGTGSLGVFMLQIDESEALAKVGIKVNAISAGDYKLEGASWEPLSEEARAHLQGQVDLIYRDFVSTVAKGRGISAADVKKNFGQGRCFDAKEALSRGMIDKIATLDDTVARMVTGRRSSVGARAAAPAFDETHAHDSQELLERMAGASSTVVMCHGQMQGAIGATCARPSTLTREVAGAIVPYCDECAAAVDASASPELVDPAAPEPEPEPTADVPEAQVAADRDRARAALAIARASGV